MAEKEISKEVEIIIQYEDNTDKKEEKSLQSLMQILFNSYIKKIIQNFYKGK